MRRYEVSEAIGKTVKSIDADDSGTVIVFTDGSSIEVFYDGMDVLTYYNKPE